jgi:type I restriction enzyme M protein
MAQISIVRKSQLEGAMRLDAEYYQPKYLRIMEALQALGAIPLSDVAKPMKRKFKPNENPFNYIEIAEVDIGTGATNATEIDGMEAPSRAQWIVREGDVIISTVRPARNAVALIGNGEDGFVCSSGFAVLRSDKTSSEFLFAYLKTSIVASLLDRKTTATMYPAVSWDDVLSLPVVLPDPDTERFISNKVKESRQRLKDSESLYLQAEQRLLDELGFNELDLSHQLYYTVPFKKTREANRLDAEHFQPKYDRVVEFIRGGQHTTLGGLGKVLRGRNPSKYAEEGIPVIRAIDLRNILDTSTFLRCPQERGLFYLQRGDILISSIGWGSIGKVATFVHPERMVTVSEVSVIRQTELEPFALQIFLQSPLGQLQLERRITGSTGQLHLYPRDIATVVVPRLVPSIQRKIADLVIQSWEARQKARQLLEEAKHKVEAIIEGKASLQ